jgi:hypothetical protein
LPPSNFDGKATVPQDQVNPTADDIAFAKAHGLDAKTYAKAKKSVNKDSGKIQLDGGIDNLLS